MLLLMEAAPRLLILFGVILVGLGPIWHYFGECPAYREITGGLRDTERRGNDLHSFGDVYCSEYCD